MPAFSVLAVEELDAAVALERVVAIQFVDYGEFALRDFREAFVYTRTDCFAVEVRRDQLDACGILHGFTLQHNGRRQRVD